MNRITSLLGIRYPIIQGGMVWCSGWRLASAVSNAGGLGLIGAGSMHPETLREHIRKCRVATKFPFGVNIPLMYPQIEEIMNIVVEEGVKIVFTSAGNPKTWTGWLKERGITVIHVVSSSRFAVKCEEAGVDAVVAEGFEAGGHNGREETTTFCLIPAVRDQNGGGDRAFHPRTDRAGQEHSLADRGLPARHSGSIPGAANACGAGDHRVPPRLHAAGSRLQNAGPAGGQGRRQRGRRHHGIPHPAAGREDAGRGGSARPIGRSHHRRHRR